MKIYKLDAYIVHENCTIDVALKKIDNKIGNENIITDKKIEIQGLLKVKNILQKINKNKKIPIKSTKINP